MTCRVFEVLETGCASCLLGCGNAAELYDGIHGKLLALPGELELCPGDFAGSAGRARMSGKPSSTLAFERRFHPMLGLDREVFVALADGSPRPAEMDAMLRANRGEGA